MFRSLGKKPIDGNVIVTFLAVDESAVGHQPLAAATSASMAPIQAAISAPLPAPIPQADPP
eukprot:13251341-Heterocapsa_arctica.AAC.1